MSLAVRAKPVPALERPKGRQCCSSEDAGIVRRAVQGCVQFGGWGDSGLQMRECRTTDGEITVLDGTSNQPEHSYESDCHTDPNVNMTMMFPLQTRQPDHRGPGFYRSRKRALRTDSVDISTA